MGEFVLEAVARQKRDNIPQKKVPWTVFCDATDQAKPVRVPLLVPKRSASRPIF